MKWYYITKPNSIGRFFYGDTEPTLTADEKICHGPYQSFSSAKRVALKIARDIVASGQVITKLIRAAKKTDYVNL